MKALALLPLLLLPGVPQGVYKTSADLEAVLAPVREMNYVLQREYPPGSFTRWVLRVSTDQETRYQAAWARAQELIPELSPRILDSLPPVAATSESSRP